MILLGQYTAAERKKALEDAERRIDLEDHKPTVELRVKQIKTMPALFQPRERLDGGITDTWHVKSLKRAVQIYEDIEPPLVIRLKGTGFVIVDGHHTVEAYKDAKRTTVKCEWFPGTVKAAMDQSMLRNGRDKLAVKQADRAQEAWKRVLIGGWTATQIKVVCGIHERTVKRMRQVIKVAEENSKRGAAFRTRLREYVVKGNRAPVEYGEEVDAKDTKAREWLEVISWQVAMALRKGEGPEEKLIEERAAALARALVNKMERKLSREPRVTALALRLYDKDLPKSLMAEWAAMDTVGPEALNAARAAWVKLNEEASDRGKRAARTRARREAEAEVAKAANAKMYAKEPEARQEAEVRYGAALDKLNALKEAHAEQGTQRA
jgi:hypothetical protein